MSLRVDFVPEKFHCSQILQRVRNQGFKFGKALFVFVAYKLMNYADLPIDVGSKLNSSYGGRVQDRRNMKAVHRFDKVTFTKRGALTCESFTIKIYWGSASRGAVT